MPKETINNALAVLSEHLNNFSSKDGQLAQVIKNNYADLYRITGSGLDLIIADYCTKFELLAEFDEMSRELLSFKGWVQIRYKDHKSYNQWNYGEIELKPVKNSLGLIYHVKGTIEWLESNKDTGLNGKTIPLSAKVRYEFPEGKICGFKASDIGYSEFLNSAVIEFRNTAKIKLELEI